MLPSWSRYSTRSSRLTRRCPGGMGALLTPAFLKNSSVSPRGFCASSPPPGAFDLTASLPAVFDTLGAVIWYWSY